MKNSNKGFTLIELVIVMVIVSILVIMASPEIQEKIGLTTQTNIRADIATIESDYLDKLNNQEEIESEGYLKVQGIKEGELEVLNKHGKGIPITENMKKVNTEGLNVKTKLPGVFLWDEDNNQVLYYDTNKNKTELKFE